MIAALKAIPAIVQMVNYFFGLWYSITDAQISTGHDQKQAEMDALMGAIHNATNDAQRVLLARSLNRVRQL